MKDNQATIKRLKPLIEAAQKSGSQVAMTTLLAQLVAAKKNIETAHTSILSKSKEIFKNCPVQVPALCQDARKRFSSHNTDYKKAQSEVNVVISGESGATQSNFDTTFAKTEKTYLTYYNAAVKSISMAKSYISMMSRYRYTTRYAGYRSSWLRYKVQALNSKTRMYTEYNKALSSWNNFSKTKSSILTAEFKKKYETKFASMRSKNGSVTYTYNKIQSGATTNSNIVINGGGTIVIRGRLLEEAKAQNAVSVDKNNSNMSVSMPDAKSKIPSVSVTAPSRTDAGFAKMASMMSALLMIALAFM